MCIPTHVHTHMYLHVYIYIYICISIETHTPNTFTHAKGFLLSQQIARRFFCKWHFLRMENEKVVNAIAGPMVAWGLLPLWRWLSYHTQKLSRSSVEQICKQGTSASLLWCLYFILFHGLAAFRILHAHDFSSVGTCLSRDWFGRSSGFGRLDARPRDSIVYLIGLVETGSLSLCICDWKHDDSYVICLYVTLYDFIL